MAGCSSCCSGGLPPLQWTCHAAAPSSGSKMHRTTTDTTPLLFPKRRRDAASSTSPPGSKRSVTCGTPMAQTANGCVITRHPRHRQRHSGDGDAGRCHTARLPRHRKPQVRTADDPRRRRSSERDDHTAGGAGPAQGRSRHARPEHEPHRPLRTDPFGPPPHPSGRAGPVSSPDPPSTSTSRFWSVRQERASDEAPQRPPSASTRAGSASCGRVAARPRPRPRTS